MDLTKKPLGKWLKDIITLVVGILLIIAGATDRNTNAISQVIGITLIVVGSICVLFALYVGCKLKSGFVLLGTPGTLMLLVGVSLVVELWANHVIANVLIVIPYIVIAVGIVFIVDAVMSTIFTSKIDKKAFLYMLPELIIGVAALVLGILCLVKVNNGQAIINDNVQLVILGVIVCLYSVYDFLLTVVKLPKAISVIRLGK